MIYKNRAQRRLFLTFFMRKFIKKYELRSFEGKV